MSNFEDVASSRDGNATLAVDGLVVRYGGIVAVRGVSLEVGGGEIVALLGPNGAGKSSFINGISGVIPSSGGSIHLNGRDVSHVAGFKRFRVGISQVPEGRRMVASLTVEENLLLGLDWSDKRRSSKEALDEVYELFPVLSTRRKIGAAMLSGGEQQMAAIARAMVAKPSVLLLDEPSIGLSPAMVKAAMNAIRTIADTGVAVLLAEQALHAALDIADRGYVLSRGEVAVEGKSDELRTDASVIQAFLGSAAHAPGDA